MSSHPLSRGLEEKSPTPLFYQLARQLRDEIFEGLYRPHDQLPSESAMCRQYQVSRATVRMAMDTLVAQRLVNRRHGKGSFVRPPEPELVLLTHPSMAQEMRIRGIEPSVQRLHSGYVSLPPEIAPFIPGREGLVSYEERLFLGHGEPYGIVTIYLHPALSLKSHAAASDELLLDELYDTYNVRIVEASYLYLEPILLEERDASFLQVSPGSPGLDVVRLLIDQTGRIAVYVRSLFRGDRCRSLFSSRGRAIQNIAQTEAVEHDGVQDGVLPSLPGSRGRG